MRARPRVRRPRRDRGRHCEAPGRLRARAAPSPRALPSNTGFDLPLTSSEQPHDRWRLQECVRRMLELVDGCALARQFAERLKHVSAPEGRAVLGQSRRRRQLLERQLPRGLRKGLAAEEAGDPLGVQAEPHGAAVPFRRQRLGPHRPVLRPPRGQRRDLGGVSTRGSVQLHRGFDLRAPPRERSDDALRDAANLG